MRRTKWLLAAGSVVFLLIFTAVQLLQEDETEQQSRTTPRINTSGQLRVLQNKRSNPLNAININNVQNGEDITARLNHDPEIKVIYHNNQDTSHYYDHQAAVDFISEPSEEEISRIASDIEGSMVRHFNSTYVFRSDSRDTAQLLDYFNTRENIEFAEPHYILLQNGLNIPNDLIYRERYQWNLPVIETEQGWNISRGNKRIKIAIVDTGVDLDHPDLKNRLSEGYNVLANNNNPDDDNGHGTHVAGIIASETNNREGTAGVTWFNKVMPIKALGAEGYGTTLDIAKGIFWAVDHGADVINLSLGNYQRSGVMEEAVEYAYNHNVVIVAAAGNDNSEQPSFPAAYPQVLSVSAVDYNGNRAEFSNYGDFVDIAAPGVYIPSTYVHNQYAALSGTSMAAPHVTGLAGLILSANPELSNLEVMQIIKTSAIDLGYKGKDENFGNGLIDVNNALQSAQNRQTRPEKPLEKLRNIFNLR
ncbi:peptidase S8 [Bacillus canaveralius]|uniref:Peptidase S8 n=1 Tax=Bacillus canaveralius TaxID=1403243 RepID=A0A2N5GHR7_9BACI|nr:MULTISPECIES: S8 family peptidase [Bacillus]PLR80329.1 peptidase S8 [Bacillus canaveralius]PLR85813.1 peptidase S8 [Bacillus sp. V33-4]PLR95452.1 peptidase S8 [Bacillus canaveralius]